MNPFSWDGPSFLLFYVIVLAAMWGCLLWLRHAIGPTVLEHDENQASSDLRLSDPIDIALLRGGPPMAIRLVTVGLVERSLITSNPDGMVVATAVPESLMDPEVWAILARTSTSRKANLGPRD